MDGNSVTEIDNQIKLQRSNIQQSKKRRGRPSLEMLKIDFNKVREDYKKIKSYRQVAKWHGISHMSVYRIVKGWDNKTSVKSAKLEMRNSFWCKLGLHTWDLRFERQNGFHYVCVRCGKIKRHPK